MVFDRVKHWLLAARIGETLEVLNLNLKTINILFLVVGHAFVAGAPQVKLELEGVVNQESLSELT